jgi:type II secretory pathway pseudopilin PulG
MKSSPHLRRARAFTIIELLVAIGVTALLVSLMVTVTINILNAWNRSSGQLASNATARLILDQLSQDLGGAIMKRDGNVWLAATVQRDPVSTAGDAAMSNADWATSDKPNGTTGAGSLDIGTLTNTPSTENMRFGRVGVWLRFFMVQPDSNSSLQNISAPRAVSYQIVRRNLGTVAAPQFSYQLYRAENRPYHTNPASAALSTFTIGYDLYTTATNGYNATASGGDKDPGNIRNPVTTQLIGNDVVDFGVRLYERNAAGNVVEVFPVNRRDSVVAPTAAPFSFAASSNNVKTLANTGNQTYGFPVEAELMVRVLTPEGVRLIQAIEDNKLTGQNWWDVVEQHSQIFTRRVEIKSSVL